MNFWQFIGPNEMVYLFPNNVKRNYEYVKFGSILWKIDIFVNNHLKFDSKNLFAHIWQIYRLILLYQFLVTYRFPFKIHLALLSENAFTKSKKLLPIFWRTVGSNIYIYFFTLIKNNFRFFKAWKLELTGCCGLWEKVPGCIPLIIIYNNLSWQLLLKYMVWFDRLENETKLKGNLGV